MINSIKIILINVEIILRGITSSTKTISNCIYIPHSTSSLSLDDSHLLQLFYRALKELD